MSDLPLAYLITFTTYGTRLPGHETGWVDRRNNRYGTPHSPARPTLQHKIERTLKEDPFALDALRRPLVLAAIEEACNYRGWQLEVAHVRSKHVHSVVCAEAIPEFVMNAFKAYGSRKLKEAGLDRGRRRRWTRHGSTKYLWTVESVQAAIEYVLEGQGKLMSVYRRER